MTSNSPSLDSCLLCGASGENRPYVRWTQTEHINWGLASVGSPPPEKLDFLECGTCGLVFKDPISFPVVSQERRFYLHHENDLTDQRYLNYLSRLLNPLLERIPKESEGLDFGCGPTKGIEFVCANRGFDCKSYDPFFYPDTHHLEKTYDFVTCSEVAEHFHHPGREFEALMRLLKSNAKLAVMTQSPPMDLSKWHYHWDPTHVVFYSKTTFEWLARKYGMTLEVFANGVSVFSR